MPESEQMVEQAQHTVGGIEAGIAHSDRVVRRLADDHGRQAGREVGSRGAVVPQAQEQRAGPPALHVGIGGQAAGRMAVQPDDGKGRSRLARSLGSTGKQRCCRARSRTA